MDSQFDKGLATRKQVMGEDFVARAFGGVTDFTAPIQQYITRNAWGDVWQRPGLALKPRSLIPVAMLTALGKQHELKRHVRGALNNYAEILVARGTVLHAAIYCGVPSAVEAFRTAAEVVDGAVREDHRRHGLLTEASAEKFRPDRPLPSVKRSHGATYAIAISRRVGTDQPATRRCTRSAAVLAPYLRISRAR